MSLLSEALDVIPHGDLVEIRYSSVSKDARGVRALNGVVWLERTNLGWLRTSLEKAIDASIDEPALLSLGGDNLKLLVGGHEAEPYVNVFNKRIGDVIQPGTYWIAPSMSSARTLLGKIQALAPE